MRNIAKIIHFCWFGEKALPKSAIKCINSWKHFLPEYEIWAWTDVSPTKNELFADKVLIFNVNVNAYTKFCYNHKLWAYLSDFARIYVVEQFGGLYFDTDVEVISNLSKVEFLMATTRTTAFFGFETSNYINTGLGFGAEAHHPALKAMIERYTIVGSTNIKNNVYAELDENNMVGCPAINTDVFRPYGLKNDGTLQTCLNAIILPADYMCPMDTVTGILKETENTFSIHWFTMSALPKSTRVRMFFTRPIHRLIKWVRG